MRQLEEKIVYRVLSLLFVTDCILPFILAPFWKTYDHKSMLLSVLGNHDSPVRYPFRLWMGIFGVGLIICSVRLFRSWHQLAPVMSIVLLGMIWSYAIFDCLASCFFEMGESKEMLTLAAKIHGIGSALGSTIFLFCGLLIGRMLLKMDQTVLGWGCYVSFVGLIIFFSLLITSDKPALKETIGGYEGIWQRLSYGFMYIPFIFLAIGQNRI